MRITIYATVPEHDLNMFNGELSESIRARLGEVFDDDANPITLHTLGIDIEDED